MIHELAGRRVYVGVISAKREGNVPLCPLLATWHVPDAEIDAYTAAGATVADGGDVNAAVARNTVLDEAASLDADAIILDDDLLHVKLAVAGKAVQLEPMEGLEKLVEITLASGCSLGTSAYGMNAYFLGDGPDTRRHGNPGVVAYVPQGTAFHLRQDVSMRYAEDFDFALQHHVYGLGYVVCNRLMFKFRHNDVGGLSHEAATTDGIRKSNEYMIAKWGSLVRVNPRTGNLQMPKGMS